MKLVEQFSTSKKFRQYRLDREGDAYLRSYIKKNVATGPTTPEVYEHKSMWITLLMIQMVASMARSNSQPGDVKYLLCYRWDIEALKGYASAVRVDLIPLRYGYVIPKMMRRISVTNNIIRVIREALLGLRILIQRKIVVERVAAVDQRPNLFVDTITAKYDVETVWSKCGVDSASIILGSGLYKFREIDAENAVKNNIKMYSIKRKKAGTPGVPLFLPKRNMCTRNIGATRSQLGTFDKFLDFHRQRFFIEKNYWEELFSSLNTKIYLSSHVMFDWPISAAAAINTLGGVSATFQQSFRNIPSPRYAVCADIDFGFSEMAKKTLQHSGANVQYYVTIGYIGDYAFDAIRSRAGGLRQRLENNGADTIIAFFDESTVDDGRWFRSHEFSRMDYKFLLERVLENKFIGVIFKPKKPLTLRRRLGEVAKLLDRALSTGRCYVFDEDYVSSPADAALASDVAIHDSLWAGTAAVESALTGTPTLMLDRDGWEISNLYDLGVGKVIFHDWESLWPEILVSRRKDKTHEIGDWSKTVADLDPFRDGKAIFRMTSYLQWVLTGLSKGGKRENVLSDAAERYALHWGLENVTTTS
jgi:hypothetical protein